MWYIKELPNGGGNYGNPMGQQFAGCMGLPDDLLSDYVEARGFVYPTVVDGAVTALETNEEALAAYLAEHPDMEPEPEKDELAAAVERGMIL